MSPQFALVLDDHQLLSESFTLLLEKYTDIQTVQQFQDAAALIRYLAQHSRKPFYIFLDYYLKDTNGLSVLADIRRINKSCKIIFLTSASTWPVIYHIESHSPDAILSKAAGLDVLLECLQTIAKGDYYLGPIFQKLKIDNNNSQPVVFTARELEILKYFVDGYTILETAEKTFLSKHTIVAHRRNMMSKANCSSISQLITYTSQWKLI